MPVVGKFKSKTPAIQLGYKIIPGNLSTKLAYNLDYSKGLSSALQ